MMLRSIILSIQVDKQGNFLGKLNRSLGHNFMHVKLQCLEAGQMFKASAVNLKSSNFFKYNVSVEQTMALLRDSHVCAFMAALGTTVTQHTCCFAL